MYSYYILFYICIYRYLIFKSPFFIDQPDINTIIMQSHYEKYKETIKKVARRHYNKRVSWLNQHLSDKSCKNCGESETICLKFYPHNSEIRKLTKRVGISDECRQEVTILMNKSIVVCSNCWIKLDNDLIEFINEI